MTLSPSQPSASAATLLAAGEEHAEFLRLLEASAAEREELLAAALRRGERHAARLRELLGEVEGDLERIEAERRDPEVGRAVGGWRLERLIGRGGSSRVYRARREADGLVAACKLFDRSIAPRRVGRELDALRRLDHPAIVRLLDEGSDPTDGAAFVVTELVPDAQPVTEWALARALAVEERVELVRSLRAALAAGHAAGIVHCDVSPANVLVAGDGRLKLVDFGLARRSDPGLTVTHAAAAGTPVCMAPEQVDPAFGPIGPWTDEYAAAVLAYRLLTGAAPYEVGPTLVTAAQAIAHVVPRPVREREPAVPAEVARWVDAGLEKRVARRRKRLAESSRSTRPARGTWISIAALAAAMVAAMVAVERWGGSGAASGVSLGHSWSMEEQEMRNEVLSALLSFGLGCTAMAGSGGEIQPVLTFPIPGSNDINVSSDVDGDLAIFGAPAAPGGGVAYRCVRVNGQWSVAGTFIPPTTRGGFGMGVDVDDSWVVVCDATFNGNRGCAHVWRREGTDLSFHQTLVASDGAAGDALGWTARLDGDQLFVNARLDDGWRGSIYRFTLGPSGQWQQAQKIQPPNTGGGNEFGWTIEASNGVMASTAWLSECGYSSPTGTLHVFRRGADGNYTQDFTTGDGVPGCTNFGHSMWMWASEILVNQYQPRNGRRFVEHVGVWSERPSLVGMSLVWAGADSALVFVESEGRVYQVIGDPGSFRWGSAIAMPSGLPTFQTIYHGGDGRTFAAIVTGPGGSGSRAAAIWELDIDCNSDGISDAIEIAQGAPDINANGIPDSCECLADVDESGSVTAVDISVILAVWGTNGGKYPRADVDGNDVVNAQDLAAVLGGWGPCP